MGKFRNYITEGNAGEAMEKLIVDTWNEDEEPISIFDHGTGSKIVNRMKRNGIDGASAKSVGRNQPSVSQKWRDFGVNKLKDTGKTDIIVGDRKISVKMGRARVVASKKEEALAIFYSALEQVKPPDQEVKQTINFLNSMIGTTVTAMSRGDTKKFGQGTADYERVIGAESFHQQMTKELRKFFIGNSEFTAYFAQEGLSGRVKFGDNEGTATHILHVSNDGNQFAFKSLDDISYLTKMGRKMNIKMDFKGAAKVSGRGADKKVLGHRWWSVIELFVKKVEESVSAFDGEYLTESKFRALTGRIIAFGKSLIKKVINFISKSWRNFLEFMGLVPKISLNEEIDYFG
jgi:hypothetical protein